MYWSFIPSWAREKRLKFSTFNARDDRLLESKVYKSALPGQRCIIPATHFFEPDKKHFPKPPHPWYCFREPVQLSRDRETSWLNPGIIEPEQIMPMLKTSSPDHMESWRVGDAAKNPKNDYPDLLTPVAAPDGSENRR